MNLDRRFDDRLPLETLLCAYVLDRPQRGLAVDISERGVFLNTLLQDPNPPRTPVGLEFSCLVCLKPSGPLAKPAATPWMTTFYGMGVRFTAMASLHQRMLRDYLPAGAPPAQRSLGLSCASPSVTHEGRKGSQAELEWDMPETEKVRSSARQFCG